MGYVHDMHMDLDYDGTAFASAVADMRCSQRNRASVGSGLRSTVAVLADATSSTKSGGLPCSEMM